MIKIIPQKPSLGNKLWKTVALSAFMNLHKFMQKSLIDNAKEMNDDMALEMANGSTIYIRKQKHSAVFENILEWLLAFKAYMDAVLIIYENREQELNTYRDHINKLCEEYRIHNSLTKKKFVLTGTIDPALKRKTAAEYMHA
ncbi:hypothetical protein C2G38_2165987 [Gigaspora rosea]|uniref:Uncharacterized protein n=1 Tax=Gigaspora rosea TaxID=44941 RepID=A0A397VS65_9GLOM|nr:hypothetical protein C2G38_2165987 [Gigaspora rosea]